MHDPPETDHHPSCSLHGGHRSFTARLAAICAGRPLIVIAVWTAVLAVTGYLALGIGSVVSADEMSFLSEPESARAEAVVAEAFPESGGARETVVVSAEEATVDEPVFQDLLVRLTQDLIAQTDVVQSAYSYPMLAALRPAAAEGLVSDDRRSTIIPLTLAAGEDEVDHPQGEGREALETVRGVLVEYESTGFFIETIGEQSVGENFMETAEEDLVRAELVGLPVTLAVLLLVFGALAAAGVSLLLAVVSIVTAVGLAALAGRVFDLSFFVVNMISMIGLAVGVDYALFIIARYREERRAGADVQAAIVIAGGTASRAVLFSGITVVLALLGLFLVPITTFRSLGLGAALVVAVAVVAMLTLVPAVLGVLGDGVDRLSPRFLRRPHVRTAVEETPGGHGHGAEPYAGWWGRIAHAVMVRPVISMTAAAAVLLALAVPFLGLERGSAGAETLPPGDAQTAYRVLDEDFTAGLLSPLEVAVISRDRTVAEAALLDLAADLTQNRAFVPQPQIEWSDEGPVGRLTMPLAVPANDDVAYEAVERVREEAVPAAFAGVPGQVLVGGETARQADAFALIDGYTPWVFAFVLGLSFLLLLVAFRSIVVPIKAIVMNLLSVGAAYGVLVLVFQEGWFLGVLGFQRTPTIEAWVPLFLFCILFGLSMDYHVFLLSRIRENFDVTGRNAESVAVGLRSTGRIITGAAAIMVVVFGTFAAGRLVMMQQVGFGLAVAIFLDATIVRSILVPSTMALLGRLNWYFPRWLRWLPNIRIEGERPRGPGKEPAEKPVG